MHTTIAAQCISIIINVKAIFSIFLEVFHYIESEGMRLPKFDILHAPNKYRL